MGQGTYWVQRHVSSVKAQGRRNDAETRRVERENLSVAKFNEKWNRIIDNYCSIIPIDQDGSPSFELKIQEKDKDKILKIAETFGILHSRYATLRDEINENISDARISDLTKLSTAAIKAIVSFLKLNNWPYEYIKDQKIIVHDNVAYLFK